MILSLERSARKNLFSKLKKIMALKLVRTDFLTSILGYNAAGNFRLTLLLLDHSENPSAFETKIKHLYQWFGIQKAWLTRDFQKLVPQTLCA
jgi:hypothetical protein